MEGGERPEMGRLTHSPLGSDSTSNPQSSFDFSFSLPFPEEPGGHETVKPKVEELSLSLSPRKVPGVGLGHQEIWLQLIVKSNQLTITTEALWPTAVLPHYPVVLTNY